MTTRPWKHPKTASYYLRRGVPLDLRALVGKREEKVSLGTKDPVEAKRLQNYAGFWVTEVVRRRGDLGSR